MNAKLNIDDRALKAFCESHHIVRLELFGSVVKGTSRSDSDIDVLVRFDPGLEPGLIALSQMEIELSTLLGGNVDLRTPHDLSRYFREEVMRTAVVQYAR